MEGNAEIQISDAMGRTILTANYVWERDGLSINVSELKSGFYTINITSNESVVTKKFIKL